MTLVFRYKKILRPDGSQIKTPSIPVTVYGKERIDTLALIDSGADVSAMPQALAEVLGLELSSNLQSAFGIGGEVHAVETKLTLRIQQGHEHYVFEVPLKVVMGDVDFPFLLGRAGFFERFTITFEQSQERILLKKINNSFV